MAEKKVIKGQVAQVISDREVILNRGTADGVKADMYFKIVDPKTLDVVDPETGENFGGLSKIKIVVRAVEVTERLTLARTFRTREVNIGGSNSSLGSIASAFAAPKYIDEVETLRLDASRGRPLGIADSVVGIGDPFEVISAEDAQDTQSVTLWNRSDAQPR
jgi:hypothetical protein